MKYLVKTKSVEIWEHWYEVEADSGDEANDIITNGISSENVGELDEMYLCTDEEEVIEVEPLTENED